MCASGKNPLLRVQWSAFGCTGLVSCVRSNLYFCATSVTSRTHRALLLCIPILLPLSSTPSRIPPHPGTTSIVLFPPSRIALHIYPLVLYAMLCSLASHLNLYSAADVSYLLLTSFTLFKGAYTPLSSLSKSSLAA